MHVPTHILILLGCHHLAPNPEIVPSPATLIKVAMETSNLLNFAKFTFFSPYNIILRY